MSPASDSTSREPPKPYQKRAYGQSCLPCRGRKIKCEGADNPPCKACRDYNTICEPVPNSRAKRSREDDNPIIEQFEQRLRRLERLASLPHTLSPSPAASGPTIEDELARPYYDLGTSHRPVYHGETSMFGDIRASAATSPKTGVPEPDHWTEESIRSAARLRHRYASLEEGEAWMDSYFCWASPIYAVVHRPTFLRDMALEGPYFSQFLLIMIYITGIRLTYGMDEREREQKGEHYMSLAMSMLADETMKPGSVATIQALIGLSGRQSAVGKVTQAWMLTGMAIRMMQDMGLHLPDDEARFSTEDRDMRKRVYWSVYCWDKTMAITLGREPALMCRPGVSPDTLPPDPDDDVDWYPKVPHGSKLPLNMPYPKTALLKTFTLRQSAHLNMILESVLTNMYSPDRPNARSLSFIRSAVDRLDSWRKALPDVLKIEKPSLPLISPPANVIILNLLYFSLRILIHRPLLDVNRQSSLATSALQQCRAAAIGTHDVLFLWGKSFGHFCHHYLFLYCCFVSAGVDILLIRTGNAYMRDEAFQRVHLSLDILEQASRQGPGIRRGISTIRGQLNRAVESTPQLAPDPELNPTVSPSLLDPLYLSTDSDLWDNNLLISLLGEAPITTEDPFAFCTNGGMWNL